MTDKVWDGSNYVPRTNSNSVYGGNSQGSAAAGGVSSSIPVGATIPSGTLGAPTYSIGWFTTTFTPPQITTDCEPMTFKSVNEDGTPAKVELHPDSSMTAVELAKICTAAEYSTVNPNFSLTGWIRKNNLEKHFKFL